MRRGPWVTGTPARPQRPGEAERGPRRRVAVAGAWRRRSRSRAPSIRSSACAHPVGVLAVLHHARPGWRRRVSRSSVGGAEVLQRPRPVEGLGDAGRLEQVARSRSCCDRRATTWRASRSETSGSRGAHDLDLALEAGVVDPVVEAASLERVVQLAGAVGGEHHERRRGGARRCRARGCVTCVRRRAPRAGTPRTRRRRGRPRRSSSTAGRLLQRGRIGRASRNRSSYRLFSASSARPPRAGRLEGAQVQDLAREVPVVERLGGVDPLVALQPDQRQRRAPRRAPPRARSCRCRARPPAAAAAASGAARKATVASSSSAR